MLTKQFRELNRQAQVIENHKNMVNKQETLEEASENYTEFWLQNKGLLIRDAFIEGTKWQQEQDKNKYSEEEVMSIIDSFIDNLQDYTPTFNSRQEWFEQFKKK
jgi:hypothetical protein